MGGDSNRVSTSVHKCGISVHKCGISVHKCGISEAQVWHKCAQVWHKCCISVVPLGLLTPPVPHNSLSFDFASLPAHDA